MRSREWRSDGCSSDLQESLIDRPAKVRSDQRPIFPLLPSVPLQNILGIFVEDRQQWQDQLTVPDGPRIFQFHLELARWRLLRLRRRLEQKPVRAGRKRPAQLHEYVRRKNGSAPCRERVCQSVSHSVVDVSYKKKTK